MMCVVSINADGTRADHAAACTSLRDEEIVETWRTSDHDSLLWMRGVTTSYNVDPLGEYVFGVVERGGYVLSRQQKTYRVGRGDLVALDPASRHSGSTEHGRAWHGRLLVIEASRLHADLTDDGITVDLDIVEPVLRDPQLAARFVQLHRAAERRRPAFELEGSLHELIADIADRSPTTRRCSSRRTPSIRAALERLHGDIARTATLDELASIAEMSRYALVRRFKAEIGLPPHTYQTALRVQLAKRLIEAGARPVDAAVRAGFTDQSHLNRHFRRIGMTPAVYAKAVARGRLAVRSQGRGHRMRSR
jgi:AraC-like DNA-binding protein